MTTPTFANAVTLGLVQMRCTPEPAANLAKALKGIREAAGRGAQIVCLQELFRSQYFCQTEDHSFFDLAESVPGPSTEVLGKMADDLLLVLLG
jgi:N-carbamoylputrescine amidase